MNHLFNLLLIALLLTNLLGLTFWVQALSRLPFGLAKVVTVVGGCLLFFCLEHFVGLGPLAWLLPLTTSGALFGIWKHQALWKSAIGGEVAFLAGFGYCLLWRYSLPDLNDFSERLADLNYLSSYWVAGMNGDRLPPTDLWLNGYGLTTYYTFQHYAAALAGRLFSIPVGTAYHLGYCVVTGLVLAPAYELVLTFTERRFRQVLILAALLLGGTGASVVTPFTVNNEIPMSSTFYVGSTDCAPDFYLNSLGKWIRDRQFGPGLGTPVPPGSPKLPGTIDPESIPVLPMEVFSYLVFLGDYHSPLGGYVLLAAALASFGVLLKWPARIPRRWAVGVLTATVPLSLACNAWIFPLQTFLVAGCLVFLWVYRWHDFNWFEIVFLSAPPWLLLYPFFSYFLARNAGNGMEPHLVGAAQHTPALSFLVLMWPVLGLIGLTWFSTRGANRNFRWFTVAVIFGLVLTEIVFIDDPYGGRCERFNTTLKWWPWTAAVAVLLLGSVNLADAASSRVARVGTIVILLATLGYAVRLGRDWVSRPKPSFGQLDGAGWLRRVDQAPGSSNLSVNATLLNYLRAHPGGVVLEMPIPNRNAFVETGAIPLFTGHPSVFGWTSHEEIFRGYQRDITLRLNRATEFFRGDLAAPLDYLAQQDVRFIIWPGSREVDPALFARIKSQIESKYTFIRFDEGQPTKGIWERK